MFESEMTVRANLNSESIELFLKLFFTVKDEVYSPIVWDLVLGVQFGSISPIKYIHLFVNILLLKNFSIGLLRVELKPIESELARIVLEAFLARRRLGVIAADGSKNTSRTARLPVFNILTLFFFWGLVLRSLALIVMLLEDAYRDKLRDGGRESFRDFIFFFRILASTN